MQVSAAKVVRFVRNGMEPPIVLLAIVVLRQFDLSGSEPLWILALVLLVTMVIQQPATQSWISGHDPGKRLWLRIGLHILSVTVIGYLTGWGALLAIAHLHILSTYLRNHDPGDDQDIFALGLVNSLFAMQLVSYVEKEFGITVEEEDLEIENFSTINAIAALVERKAGAARCA